MLADGMNTIRTTAEQVNQWSIWILYVISLMYIVHLQKKNKYISYVKVSVIGIIIICNPVFAGIVGNIFFSDNRYFRIIWILPIYIVIALVASEISEQKGKKVAVLVAITICLSGNWIGTGNFVIAENPYKLPQATIDICEYFKDTKEYKEGRLKISVDPELSCYIRQYDGNIILQYGRQSTVYTESQEAKTVYAQLQTGNIDIETLTSGLRIDNCDYVVIKEGKVLKEDMQEYGYVYQEGVSGYEIYKDIW